MNHTTYWLGAGASANAIPINSGLAEDMMNVDSRLEGDYLLRRNLNAEQSYLVDQMLGSIRMLGKAAIKENSVDHLALIYYSSGQVEQLRRLKCTMCAYFNILQSFLKCFDKRYDEPITNICKIESGVFEPKHNIRILSWNYDYQLELALQKFQRSSSLISLQSNTNIVPNESTRILKQGKFGVCKINGTLGYRHKVTGVIEFNAKSLYEEDRIATLLEIAQWFHKSTREGTDYDPDLQFAFESSDLCNDAIASAKESVAKTTRLVIIGYSFPLMNHTIDVDLFRAMPKVKEIFFQTKESEQSVRDKIGRVLPIAMRETLSMPIIRTWNTIDQFYRLP